MGTLTAGPSVGLPAHMDSLRPPRMRPPRMRPPCMRHTLKQTLPSRTRLQSVTDRLNPGTARRRSPLCAREGKGEQRSAIHPHR